MVATGRLGDESQSEVGEEVVQCCSAENSEGARTGIDDGRKGRTLHFEKLARNTGWDCCCWLHCEGEIESILRLVELEGVACERVSKRTIVVESKSVVVFD